MRYAIVIEKAAGNITEAIVFHLEGLREDRIAPPASQCHVASVDV